MLSVLPRYSATSECLWLVIEYPLPMNRLRHGILLVSVGIILARTSARAEDLPAEPIELTRLRQ